MDKFTLSVLTLQVLFLAGFTTAQPNPVCSKLPTLDGLLGNSTCCSFPMLLDAKIMNQCWNEQKNSTDTDTTKHCKSLECFFKKSNALKADNSLDRAVIETYLTTHLKDNAEWLPSIKQIALDNCLVSIEKDYSKMMDFFKTNKMELPEAGKCSMKPMLMSICVMAKGFAGCPAKHWNKGPNCDDWKKYLASCTDTIENTLEFYKQLDKAQ
ncbi:general odorant-binding protein 68-like isoform X2 [Topomyia yanbarensis]|uniref:general odorant-binding protein 68-like isoform X2 n=1 Tax=Topomyia yanbarensis TaxID=2498891 RepID=UPI00273B0F3A|nr:general odorant-binding protein 68-like isoform X2 [Topomyia yanbarensis]